MEETQDRFIALKSINPSKMAIKSLADQVAMQVEDGEIDPISLAVRISAMETLCKELRERLGEQIVGQLAKETGKAATWSGAKIETAEVGTSYDYSTDQKWKDLAAENEVTANALKSHQDALKKIPAGKVIVDEDSGETWTAPIKTSKTSYKVTLSKD